MGRRMKERRRMGRGNGEGEGRVAGGAEKGVVGECRRKKGERLL